MLEHEIPTAPEGLTQLLGLDHRRLDGILADAKRRLVAGDLARARVRFAEFRSGLEHHILVEEEIVFPAFEALCGPAAGEPTRVMRAEHVEIRRLMAEVAASLERGSVDGRTTPLAALTARIYAHNGKEERILYPAADRVAAEAGASEALVARVMSRSSEDR
jgi:iron-sulfur cluster repair protein YtfE (RIC family)